MFVSNLLTFLAGLRSRSRNQSEVFGWSRIPNNPGSRIFCPTPDVQLDHFLYHTPNLGIPVEMVQFLLKLLLKHIFCCATRFPLILNAKILILSFLNTQASGFPWAQAQRKIKVDKKNGVLTVQFAVLKNYNPFLVVTFILQKNFQ